MVGSCGKADEVDPRGRRVLPAWFVPRRGGGASPTGTDLAERAAASGVSAQDKQFRGASLARRRALLSARAAE